MQPAKDPFGSDGIRLSAAMARIGNREDEGTDRRIGNTGTQPVVPHLFDRDRPMPA